MAKTPDNTISIFTLLEAVRRRKFTIIIPTILLGAGFTWYAMHQPNRYRAQALIAATNVMPPSYLKEVAPQPLNIQDHLWTVREVLFSQPILDKAHAAKDSISIKVEGEHTFTVSYEGTDPEQVANVTKTLAESFVAQASAKTEQRNEDAQTVIQKQIDALKQRLAEQDRQVKNYKQGAAHELPEHVDDNIRAVDELRAQQLSVESKQADDEAKKVAYQKEMRELESQGALEQPVETPAPTPAETRLEDLQFKLREEQARGHKPDHPDVKKLVREIDEAKKLVASQPAKATKSQPTQTYLRYVQLKSELDGITERLSGYKRELATIAAQMEGFNRRVESAPRHERNLDALTREMTVGESQLHSLLDKQLDTNISEGLQKSDTGIAFGIVEPARVPTEPYSPQRARMILMGICAGLGLGIIAAFLLEQNDTTFGSVEEFQAFTTMAVAGVIPTIPGQKQSGRLGRSAIVTLNDPDSVPAEQFRILGMKVHQLCLQQNARILMVTSSAGGEGKSMTAVNLGLAMSGLVDGPVLLVDADMRRPRLHEYLESELSSGNGFHDLLLKPDDDVQKYVVRLEGLHVIPGSTPTANPIAALASPRVRTLFDRLKQQFNFIVVDAPPTLPIADSHILSGLCDKVLFVVRSRRTPRELFQHAVESFDAANLVGAVLNDVEYQRSSYGYAYRYYRENYLARK